MKICLREENAFAERDFEYARIFWQYPTESPTQSSLNSYNCWSLTNSKNHIQLAFMTTPASNKIKTNNEPSWPWTFSYLLHAKVNIRVIRNRLENSAILFSAIKRYDGSGFANQNLQRKNGACYQVRCEISRLSRFLQRGDEKNNVSV